MVSMGIQEKMFWGRVGWEEDLGMWDFKGLVGNPDVVIASRQLDMCA